MWGLLPGWNGSGHAGGVSCGCALETGGALGGALGGIGGGKVKPVYSDGDGCIGDSAVSVL